MARPAITTGATALPEASRLRTSLLCFDVCGAYCCVQCPAPAYWRIASTPLWTGCAAHTADYWQATTPS
eukprot:8459544-Pyramimonas_sp.AAC.1